MKIAVPIWNQRVAPLFDVAREIVVAEMAMEKRPNQKRETLTGALPVQKALRLVELGVDILICSAISRPTLAMVTGYGIRVVPHVVGQAAEVIQAWSQGRLESDPYRMPGCRRRGRHSLRGRKIAYEEEKLMPGRNRTGPMGMGPMSGRGAGPCAGYAGQGRPYPRTGRGCGMGYAWGRGFGGAGWRQAGAVRRGGWMRFAGYDAPYGYSGGYAPTDPIVEKQTLNDQAKALQAELEWIHKRLEEMETKAPPNEQ